MCVERRNPKRKWKGNPRVRGWRSDIKKIEVRDNRFPDKRTRTLHQEKDRKSPRGATCKLTNSCTRNDVVQERPHIKREESSS
jgi:hypothetical protein